MNRHYYIANSKIILQGDTYPIKDEIKKRGGRWDGDQKHWWLDEKQQSLDFLSEIGFVELSSANHALTQQSNEISVKSNDSSSLTMTITQFVTFIGGVVKRNLGEKYWIHGEISNLKTANGHVFFDLADKDDKTLMGNGSFKATSLPCILWSGKKISLADKFAKIALQDGTKIKILVSCDFRKEGARISAIIEDINEEYTQGDLLLQRLAIVRELKKRGLYDKNKKLIMPHIPLRIALITAETSRASSDFINELTISKISFQVTLFDCNMQGEKTSANVCSALQKIGEIQHLFDCVVLTRGGGSRLDLRWFDDLEIAKQIAYCTLPVIVAVGHFEDISVADEVAFLSEKTPTAAARFLCIAVSDSLTKLFLRVESLGTQLLRRFAREKQSLISLGQRFAMSALRRIDTEKRHLQNTEHILRVCKTNITQTLRRGFVLAYDENGKIITGKDFLGTQIPQNLKLKFAADSEHENIFVDVSVKGVSKCKKN